MCVLPNGRKLLNGRKLAKKPNEARMAENRLKAGKKAYIYIYIDISYIYVHIYGKTS